MLAMALIAAGACAASLTAGLVARARLAGCPVDRASAVGGAGTPGWGPLARGLVAPDRGLAGLAIWLMIVDTALALAAPWPLMLVVDYGFGHHPRPSWLPAPGLGPVALAAVAAAAGLLLVALGAVATYLVTFLVGAMAERMTVRLRAGLVTHVLHAVPHEVRRFPLGELTSRLGADTAAVAETVAAVVETLIPDSAVLAGMTVITALLDWRLTLVVLGVIPLYAITARFRNRALRGAQRQARARAGDLAALAAEMLARIPLIHVFDAAGAEAGRYGHASTRAAAAAVTALDASARFAPVADTLPGLGLAAALVAGTAEVTAGRLTLGGLLVFLAYLSSLTTPVRSLARLSTVIARGSASRERVAELLRLPALEPASEVPPRPGRAIPRHRAGRPACPSGVTTRMGQPAGPSRAAVRLVQRLRGPAISLEQVTFAHRPGQPVLTAASLHVPPGAFACVTGPSGAGKSTLLSLLIRLVDPQAGRIALDGRDISGIPLRELRELVTLVPQDPWLQTGTIAENIGYGRPGASRAQILAAAGAAGVPGFAKALPDGYGTQVGAHGGLLSGGQRRRVAVARALLRDTPVLLLDEPTSGLDPAAESCLIDELLAAARGKTLILVTHQPRLTAGADQIIQVSGGRFTGADATGPAQRASSA